MPTQAWMLEDGEPWRVEGLGEWRDPNPCLRRLMAANGLAPVTSEREPISNTGQAQAPRGPG